MLSPASPSSRILRNISTPVHGGLLRVAEADDLDRVAGVDLALLHPAGDDCAPAGDGEHVLDRHEERLVGVALGLGDVLVDLGDQLLDLLLRGVVTVQRLQRRDPHDRDVVAGELVLRQELADLELDQVEQLLVVDLVDLVEGNHDGGHAHLAGEQHVLRVWGMGPSAADTTRMAPSTWAAPVIMFLM